MSKNMVRLSFTGILMMLLASCGSVNPAAVVPPVNSGTAPAASAIKATAPAVLDATETLTVLPGRSGIITAANAKDIAEIASWGKGNHHHPVYSPDGGLIAVLSSSGIYLFDLQTLQEKMHLALSESADLAFSPDGKTLSAVASTYYDYTVKMWDVAGGTELHSWTVAKKVELNQQTAKPIAVLSPDGKTAAISFDVNTVKLWDVAGGKERHSLGIKVARDAAFSPDGREFAAAEFGTVTLWDTAGSRPLRSLDIGPVVISLAFSPDGKTLAVGADHSAYGSGDNTTLWDLASGSQQHSFKTDLPFSMETVSAFGLAFSPDGTKLATGSARGNTVKLWDVAGGSELRSLSVSNLESLAFSPDGATLLSASGTGDDTVKLWDAASGNLRGALKSDSAFGKVIFSPDGRTLAYPSDDYTVRLRDAASGEVRTLSGHTGYAGSLAFSPDGRTLASGSSDQTVKLWDVITGREILTMSGHTSSVSCVAFSPDGKTLASASFDSTVKLWDTAGGNELRTLSGHTSLVWSVAFSPDGKTLASGSEDGTVKLWDAASGAELRTLGGGADPWLSVSFSPDGKQLLSSSYSVIKLWDAASGKELHTVQRQPGRIYGAEHGLLPGRQNARHRAGRRDSGAVGPGRRRGDRTLERPYPRGDRSGVLAGRQPAGLRRRRYDHVMGRRHP